MTCSAPAAAASRAFSGLLTVVITVASDHRASWIAALPTAPAPPATSTTRASSEPVRAVLGDREAAASREERHAEAGAQVEGRLIGQRHHSVSRDDRVLLGGAFWALVGGLPHPHPLTDERCPDARPSRVHHAGAVLVRRLRRNDRRSGSAAAARLPVGRIDPGAVDAHAHLTGSRLTHRLVDQPQDIRVTGPVIDDGSHESTVLRFARTLTD